MKAVKLLLLCSLLPQLAYGQTFVSVGSAKSLLFYPQRTAPAKVVPLNASLLPAEVGAKLTQLPVRVGEQVKKGQVLAQLDCQDAQYQLQIQQGKIAQLKSQLAFDQAELLRGEKLAKENNIGVSELERRKNQVNSGQSLLVVQQAVLSLAKLTVDRCQVKAPFNGVITKRLASVGAMAPHGSPIVELVDTDTLEVSAQIATDDFVSFQNAAHYQLDALAQQHSLKLEKVVPVIEQHARSQEVRFSAVAEQGEPKLVAGSTGRIIWTSPSAFLPAHLLQRRNNKTGYFIVENNVANFIEVANSEEGRPIVFSGQLSDKVVVDGRFGLKHGEQVTIVSAKASENEASDNSQAGE